MGQKTNSNLLRLNINNNEWKSKYTAKTVEEFSLITFKNLEIKNYLEQFFQKNGLILHEIKLYLNNNSLYLHISYFSVLKSIFIINKNINDRKLFLTKKKINFLQKKKLIIKSELLKQKDFHHNIKTLKKRKFLLNKYILYLTKKKYYNQNILQKNVFSEQLLETLKLFTNNKSDIYITFQNLNSKVLMNLKQNTWKKKLISLKKYRKRYFFKETINIVLLTLKLKNSAQLLASFLAKQLIRKNKNFLFFIFLKHTFNLFLNSKISNVRGVKIIISGRLNRRPRAKKNIIDIGNIPTQTLNVNVNYFESTAFSSNGTFGIKVWVAEK